MTDTTPNLLLPLKKVFFGGYLTYGIDARDLHSALQIDKEFPSWIRFCIASGNFLKNQDFLLRFSSSNRSGPDIYPVYSLSLDMAKAIAVLEPPSQHRSAVRQFLLETEKGTVLGLLSANRLTFDRDVDEIIEIRMSEALTKRLPVMLSKLLDDKCIQVRYGRTAGQIWDDSKFPKIRGISRWFGDRLAKAGCLVDGKGYGELGNTRARLFDPDRAKRWLATGGKKVVDLKILEALGQRAFDFGRPHRTRP